MKIVLTSLLLFFFMTTAAHAQVPIAAGYAPVIKVDGGYSYVNLGAPSRPRVNLHGGELGVTLDFNPRFGIELDGSYTRASDVYGTRHVVDLLSYMGGPVFYLKRGKRLDVFVHTLAGGARETGVNFDSQGRLLLGYVEQLAWAAGGGAEFQFDRNLSLRLGSDYLNTGTFTPQSTIKRESNIRAFIGFTYRFGGRRP